MGKIIGLMDYKDKRTKEIKITKKDKPVSKYSLALQKATKEEFLMTVE